MKLKKQFDDFYDKIRIREETEELKEKREILTDDIVDYFPSELDSRGIEINKSDIEIFDQGSYHYHTTINTEPYDRDVAVAIPLDTGAHDDPREIKKAMRDALSKVSARTVSIKEPCVNVAYYENGEEWMHIDLPIYAKRDSNYYLARGKENSDSYSWEIADPHGLNNDLDGYLKDNSQLRRMIRLVKKWRDVQYESSSRDHEVPPSIGLTYLVCDTYSESLSDGVHNDLQELQTIFIGIKQKFSLTYKDNELVKADITRYLPVQPYSDIFKRMKDSSDSYGVKFYNRVCTALSNINNAINAGDDHTASDYVRRLFGEEFELVPKKPTSGSSFSRREHSFG